MSISRGCVCTPPSPMTLLLLFLPLLCQLGLISASTEDRGLTLADRCRSGRFAGCQVLCRPRWAAQLPRPLLLAHCVQTCEYTHRAGKSRSAGIKCESVPGRAGIVYLSGHSANQVVAAVNGCELAQTHRVACAKQAARVKPVAHATAKAAAVISANPVPLSQKGKLERLAQEMKGAAMLDPQLLPSETDAASLQSETDAAKLALFKHLKAEISTMPAEESKPQSKHPPLIAAVVALGLLAVLAWGLRARLTETASVVKASSPRARN